MADLVNDCPRCGAKRITFDVQTLHLYHTKYRSQHYYEAFSICKKCNRATTFLLEARGSDAGEKLSDEGLDGIKSALNSFVRVDTYVNISHFNAAESPDHLPATIDSAFCEGARCHAIGCYNAAGAMFRQCIDLATKQFLPKDTETDKVPKQVRFSLGHRLPWLFDNGHLPEALRELSSCIKEDGNDAAHDGTLLEADSIDLQDFTTLVLERIYTEHEQVRLAAERRDERRRKAADRPK